jgi:hypothetical protein
MSTTAPTDEAVAQIVEATTPEATAPQAEQRKMFTWQSYLNVGEGADACEHARDGQCSDMEHFHAWCRLPNPLQHEDIRKKGQAAKARKLRAYKDPDSDESVIMDHELEQINDPIYIKILVDELLAHQFIDDYTAAKDEVDDREEYEHIEQDREELLRLEEAEASLEEKSAAHQQLTQHVSKYVADLQAVVDRLQKPQRDELEARGPEGLVEIVREKRVEAAGDRAFLDTYNPWTWFVGTYEVELHADLKKPYKLKWPEIGSPLEPSPGSMYSERPDVIQAIRERFADMQVAIQRGSAGN